MGSGTGKREEGNVSRGTEAVRVAIHGGAAPLFLSMKEYGAPAGDVMCRASRPSVSIGAGLGARRGVTIRQSPSRYRCLGVFLSPKTCSQIQAGTVITTAAAKW